MSTSPDLRENRLRSMRPVQRVPAVPFRTLWPAGIRGYRRECARAPDLRTWNEIVFEGILSTSPDLRETGCVRCVLFIACRLYHSARRGISEGGDIVDLVPPRWSNPAGLDAIGHLVRASVDSR